MRLADPKPAYCSSCFQSGGSLRYIDFEAAWDGPVIVDEKGVPALAPDGVASTSDDLVLCEHCVREAAQILETKPELHQRQLREIKRLESAVDHWRSYAKRAEATVATRPDEPVRRRKVAA